MTNIQLLSGSLSNDLFRVASLTQRGSTKAAVRFLHEAKRWARELQKYKTANYIQDIVNSVITKADDNISMAEAEKYLMNGVLLQNYALHANED